MILFNSLTSLCQTEFNEIKVNNLRNDTIISNFQGINSYRFDKYELLVGIERIDKTSETRLLVLNSNKVVLKTDNPTCTCISYDIYIFKKGNQYIIFGEQGDDGILGYDIYLLDNSLKFIGKMKYTGIQKLGDINGPRSSIIPLIKNIKKDGLKIDIEFKDEEMYQIMSNGKVKIIRGKEHTFSVDI